VSQTGAGASASLDTWAPAPQVRGTSRTGGSDELLTSSTLLAGHCQLDAGRCQALPTAGHADAAEGRGL